MHNSCHFAVTFFSKYEDERKDTTSITQLYLTIKALIKTAEASNGESVYPTFKNIGYLFGIKYMSRCDIGCEMIQEAYLTDDVLEIIGNSSHLPSYENIEIISQCLGISWVVFCLDNNTGYKMNSDIEGRFYTPRYNLQNYRGSFKRTIDLPYDGLKFKSMMDVLAFLHERIDYQIDANSSKDDEEIEKSLERYFLALSRFRDLAYWSYFDVKNIMKAVADYHSMHDYSIL